MEPNLKLLIDSCTMNLNHDAFQAWFCVVGRGRDSSIWKVEVSFKSGKPNCTFLPPEDGTLVWILVAKAKQVWVCLVYITLGFVQSCSFRIPN